MTIAQILQVAGASVEDLSSERARQLAAENLGAHVYLYYVHQGNSQPAQNVSVSELNDILAAFVIGEPPQHMHVYRAV